jgi:hypothetical protein
LKEIDHTESKNRNISKSEVKTCDFIRIANSKQIQGEICRCCKATMRRWFYGFNDHVMVTTEGILLVYIFLLGNKHDSEALKKQPFDMKEGSRVYADARYTNFKIEDKLYQAECIELLIAKKSKSNRIGEPYQQMIVSVQKRVETAFSEIITLLSKEINAVTDYGFSQMFIVLIFIYIKQN